MTANFDILSKSICFCRCLCTCIQWGIRVAAAFPTLWGRCKRGRMGKTLCRRAINYVWRYVGNLIHLYYATHRATHLRRLWLSPSEHRLGWRQVGAQSQSTTWFDWAPSYSSSGSGKAAQSIAYTTLGYRTKKKGKRKSFELLKRKRPKNNEGKKWRQTMQDSTTAADSIVHTIAVD